MGTYIVLVDFDGTIEEVEVEAYGAFEAQDKVREMIEKGEYEQGEIVGVELHTPTFYAG